MAIIIPLKDVPTSRLPGNWAILHERYAVDERILLDLDQLTLLKMEAVHPGGLPSTCGQ